MKQKDIAEARDYVNTSVEDMHSSLKCAFADGRLNQRVLQAALEIAAKRGEKTKAAILQRYMKRMRQDAAARKAELIAGLLQDLEYNAALVVNIASQRSEINLRDVARMIQQSVALVKFHMGVEGKGVRA